MTTEQATRVVPAGWYQDPADNGKVRWWNGLAWTEHVESKPDAQGAAVAGALAIESAAPAVTYSEDTGRIHDFDGRKRAERREPIATSTGTIPVVGATTRQVRRAATTSGWLLSFTPLVASVLAVIAGYVFFYVSPTPLIALVGIVLWLLGLLWAVGDSRSLEARGYDHPSPLWGLALPVIGAGLYLVARRRRVPGNTLVGVFAALFAVAILLPGAAVLAGGATAVTKALEVQLAVRNDVVGSGAVESVTCPPILESTAAGSVFTCDATLATGRIVHVWVSFDDDQGTFSWALANR